MRTFPHPLDTPETEIVVYLKPIHTGGLGTCWVPSCHSDLSAVAFMPFPGTRADAALAHREYVNRNPQ